MASQVLADRGITDIPEHVQIAGDTIAFRYPSGWRFRSDGPEGRKFWWDKGTLVTPFEARRTEHPHAIITEGETDALKLRQELTQASVYGLPGIETWKDEWAQTFEAFSKVYVVLDNDSDYMVKARVDETWKKIRKALGPKAKRVHLPHGVKDVCEFFQHYNADAFRNLVKRSNTSRFKPLDLSRTPPPFDWLVEGLICRKDVTLMAGDPGLGKSWLTMALSVGIADDWGTWIGLPLKRHGRVLYIDEENPEDIVLSRFRKLGLKNFSNIRFLHANGIWLDKSADDLLDEALDYGPQLIVVDALARVHTGDENSAGDMARLFQECIKPLARETEAAVVVIHHTNKGQGNSYQRVRGSGDITASPDAAIDVRGTDIPGSLLVAPYKSRRTLGGEWIAVRLDDTPDGRVILRATPQLDPAKIEEF